ncbi:hypothetical protein ABY44_08965, partial [Burkholderia sp. ZZQ-2]|uniref:hypothetical protein n=1 Tax=Burkholderia sp. ZZQ-2 TaxID=1661766 RepID=UPI003D6F6588
SSRPAKTGDFRATIAADSRRGNLSESRAVPGVPDDTPETGCRPREPGRPIRPPRRTGANATMTIHGAPLPGQTLDAMPGRTTPQRKPTGDGHQ